MSKSFGENLEKPTEEVIPMGEGRHDHADLPDTDLKIHVDKPADLLRVQVKENNNYTHAEAERVQDDTGVMEDAEDGDKPNDDEIVVDAPEGTEADETSFERKGDVHETMKKDAPKGHGVYEDNRSQNVQTF
jgi:hypothetical protein